MNPKIQTNKKIHSLVIPVFNEKPGLPFLFSKLTSLLNSWASRYEFEVILVNDGSRDGSREVLNSLAKQDDRFKVLHFSRNFGHQVAISAGMQWASGQTVTVMDADLQDPPELIEKMLEKWQQGFEVVYAVRRQREGETRFKLWTAKVFYRLIQRITNVEIPVDTGDFRLMDRKVVDAFNSLSERHRFVRGLVSWLGFRQTGILYDRASREHGETHYPFRKMYKFAIDGVTSFSMLPLQVATYVGTGSALVAFLGIVWSVYLKLFTDKTVQGWSSLMVVVLFLGGIQLLALGLIGEYLGRMFDEIKQRPLYLVSETVGFEKENNKKPDEYIQPTL